jgi:KaiC/GvpD/RAD55 family RecA-like ATPase
MGDLRETALEVVKMRGTAHSKKLAPMKITKEGIILYPEQPFFAKE